MGDKKLNKGHFTIDTSMRPHLLETNYVGISDGEVEYSVEVPAKLKKKFFKICKSKNIQNYIEQIHCVAIAFCINALPFEQIISIRICTDISKRFMHNYLIRFLKKEAYNKILNDKSPSKSNAHYYVTKIREKKRKASLILNEGHLMRFIRLKK
ncbi:MAG: hypothetical protein WC852_06550 [Candidatus Nanoarchaeia archaeon]|jgi:hypothetical protein